MSHKVPTHSAKRRQEMLFHKAGLAVLLSEPPQRPKLRSTVGPRRRNFPAILHSDSSSLRLINTAIMTGGVSVRDVDVRSPPPSFPRHETRLSNRRIAASKLGRLQRRRPGKRRSGLENVQIDMADILWAVTGTTIYHGLLRFLEATRKASNPWYVFSHGVGCDSCACSSTRIHHKPSADQNLCA